MNNNCVLRVVVPGGLACCHACSFAYSNFLNQTSQDLDACSSDSQCGDGSTRVFANYARDS
jgi:hypothetical protein